MFKIVKFGLIASAILSISPLALCANTCPPTVTKIVAKMPDLVNFPGNPVVHDFYGSGGEINGDYFFVIAPGAHPAAEPTKTAAGAVYVYHKEQGTWVQKQILTTNGTSDHLGASSVRAQGKWLFVSAFGTPIGGNTPVLQQDFKGSVRIYQLNQNTGLYEIKQVLDSATVPELADLSVRVFTNPSDPSQADPSGALFGSTLSVNVDRGWMVVGAEGQNATVSNQTVKEAGAAYFFKLDNNGNWKYMQKVTRPNGPIERGNFGSVVETDGRWAFVSNGDLLNHPEGRLPNATVWVYHRDNNQWNFVQQLSGGQTQAQSDAVGFFDAFGNTMSVDNRWLMVGAPLDSTNGRAMGAVYVFKRTNGVWNATQTIYSDEAFNPQRPGHMLAFLNGLRVQNNRAVIGDLGHTGPTGNARQGAVLVYKRDGNSWNKVITAFNPDGAAFDFFGVGATLRNDFILAGPLTAVDFAYPNFVPPLRTPPTAVGQAVLFKRDCF